MNLPMIKPHPTRILYQTAVVMTAIFIIGFLWFVLYAVIVQIQASTASAMSQYDVANTTYQAYELAETFMFNIWIFMLAIIMLGLGYWVYIYSQRKGQVYGI